MRGKFFVIACRDKKLEEQYKLSEEYLREMRKLELQEKHLVSQYDNDEEKLDPNNYKSVTNANIEYSPHKIESWHEYSERVKIYVELAAKKNRLTHIDGPRKAWYTHRSPMGCFMCEDTNLIHMLSRVICEMAQQYPENHF